MGIAVLPQDLRRATVRVFSRLRTPQGQANPLPHYAELAASGPVSPAPWGGHLVTGFAECDQILRDRQWCEPDRRWRERQGQGTRWAAPSSQEMSHALPNLNGPEHARIRRAADGFDRAAIGRLRPVITTATDRLLDTFHEQLRHGEADFAALVGEELPIATVGHWLGLPRADWPRLRELTHDQVFTQELLPTASQLARSDAATVELRTYFTDLVRARRARPGDDPVSQWIRTWDTLETDRDQADHQVYHLARFVLLAALETTATLLSQAVLHLVEHPLHWDAVAADPELVPGAVEESLRYDPPTHVISRVASHDMRLAGRDIREGEMAHLLIGAAHHDPHRHADPATYNPHRNPGGHLAFSGGVHYCLGAPLARLEAQTLITQLTRRIPRLTLVRPPTWAPRVAFRRLLNLDLTLA
ncbi:cytochrome P450 [Streptomyces sp. NBC_00006]|uniref:cytochrome P450 n=1 Tax=Streptomyces sp. NBC_00006 TaxID=2975619 RepID=UPI00225A6C4D|nr:cytochrome P450 [Streptomyces sp. NBC_00006]MCX5536835.1 cytochrome P450 [Streptomyces sp. NBC_00006]MCX5536864.1 cytochrome P450 [Streptomyces sp. NBC_00006]